MTDEDTTWEFFPTLLMSSSVIKTDFPWCCKYVVFTKKQEKFISLAKFCIKNYYGKICAESNNIALIFHICTYLTNKFILFVKWWFHTLLRLFPLLWLHNTMSGRARCQFHSKQLIHLKSSFIKSAVLNTKWFGLSNWLYILCTK